jgi:hypothetical protein
VVPIIALPERDLRQSGGLPLPRPGHDRSVSRIESEIVIVDDDGTEVPFDPATWFE